MLNQEKIILSICIPTFNRGYMLNRFFRLLKEAVSGVENKIEILISNNNSSDNSSQICQEWGAALSSKIKFRYFEQEANIGVARNIIFLLEKSIGKYFVVIGDDDCLNGDNLLRTMELLQSNNSPSAIIQGKWGARTTCEMSGFKSFLDAAELFYEYGNAYAAIVDRQAAQKIISDGVLRPEIEEIVWPQTVFGFLAIYSLRERPIFVTNYPLGMPVAGGQNIANKAYWVSSLYGLLRASFLIDRSVGFKWTKKSFVRWRVPGFRSHIISILRMGLIAENSTSQQAIKELRDHFGVPGHGWAFVLEFSDRCPKLFYGLVVIAYSVLSFQSPFSIMKRISDERASYLASIDAAKLDKRRTEGFF